jgi:hypothetical protein
MKSRTVIALWIAALTLGVIACIVQFGGNEDIVAKTNLVPGDKILPKFPIREITKVTIKKEDQSTVLVRIDKDTWGVAERANYPVDYRKLRNLLGALSELEVAQGYPAGPEHMGNFGLATSGDQDSEQGIQVLAEKSDDSNIAHIILGKFSGTNQSAGRFVRTTSDDSGVYAVSETFPGITADPQTWLGRNFLKIEKIKTIAVSAPSDPNFKSWKLIRHPNTDGTVNENGQLKLEGMEEDEIMQITSTNPLRNLLSAASFIDVVTENQANDTANPDIKLKRQAVITTFDNLTYTLTFWPQMSKPMSTKNDPRLPALQPNYLLSVVVSSDDQTKLNMHKVHVGRIYQISQNTVSPLQKKRSDFVKSKTKPTAVTPPVRVPSRDALTPARP